MNRYKLHELTGLFKWPKAGQTWIYKDNRDTRVRLVSKDGDSLWEVSGLKTDFPYISESNLLKYWQINE